MAAVVRRIGTDRARLAVEARNSRDSGARWCSVFLLGRRGDALTALDDALMLEDCPEMRRAIGYALTRRDMLC
jgi:hypothetical protein